jgi:hypothetical protein
MLKIKKTLQINDLQSLIGYPLHPPGCFSNHFIEDLRKLSSITIC